MLTHLRVKNLKTWAGQLWDDGVELAPITLFLGPNSAGKTSLLQLPLLLKQTFESDARLDLNLGGRADDLVDLGSYESLIHHHESKRELGLGLTLGGDCSESQGVLLDYRVTYSMVGPAPTVKTLSLRCGDREFGATRQQKGGYRLLAPGYSPRRFGARGDARRSFQPIRSLSFSPEAVVALGPGGSEAQEVSLRIRQLVGSVAYLGPLRERPERTYLWSGVEPVNLGKRGEFAAHALLASDNGPKKQKDGQEGGRGWLIERVSEWLVRLGVAEELRLERQGKSRHYELVVVRGGMKANIMDVGFGVSQVLPILVLAYFVPQGSVIIAEEPEIHLHPRAQVCLAEMMAEVSKSRGVQFLVETHSEHLFRRVQTLVAEERLREPDCRLYFVDQDDELSGRLSRLHLDEFGRVANWPKHFFGDALGEMERQTRRMLERIAQSRGGGVG